MEKNLIKKHKLFLLVIVHATLLGMEATQPKENCNSLLFSFLPKKDQQKFYDKQSAISVELDKRLEIVNLEKIANIFQKEEKILDKVEKGINSIINNPFLNQEELESMLNLIYQQKQIIKIINVLLDDENFHNTIFVVQNNIPLHSDNQIILSKESSSLQLITPEIFSYSKFISLTSTCKKQTIECAKIKIIAREDIVKQIKLNVPLFIKQYETKIQDFSTKLLPLRNQISFFNNNLLMVQLQLAIIESIQDNQQFKKIIYNTIKTCKTLLQKYKIEIQKVKNQINEETANFQYQHHGTLIIILSYLLTNFESNDFTIEDKYLTRKNHIFCVLEYINFFKENLIFMNPNTTFNLIKELTNFEITNSAFKELNSEILKPEDSIYFKILFSPLSQYIIRDQLKNINKLILQIQQEVVKNKPTLIQKNESKI